MLNEKIWNSIAANEGLRSAVPSWALSILDMPWRTIEKLPRTADVAVENIVFRPTLKLQTVTSSYLDFLRRQVDLGDLEPRGKEWGDILKARLKALLPYENRELYFFMQVIKAKGSQADFLLHFRPDDFGVVHVESYGATSKP